MWTGIQEYIKEFDILNYTAFGGHWLNFQKFEPNQGFHTWHYESMSYDISNRCIVFMVYMNTLTDKGNTEFKYYKHLEDPVEGKILIWPAGYSHCHRSVPSPSQEKYIITGWYSILNIK